MTIRRIAAAFILGLLGIVGTNAYFDPGARVPFGGVNLADLQDADTAWKLKPFLVREYPHDAIMIGNSRIFYIDPTKVAGFRLYNAGQPYMNAQRINSYLNRVACDLKVVVIAYDFDMFHSARGASLPKPQNDPYNNFLLQAFPEPCRGPSLFQRVAGGLQLYARNLSYLLSRDTLEKSLLRAVAGPTGARPAIFPAGNKDVTAAVHAQSLDTNPYQISEEPFGKHLEQCCAYTGMVYNRDWLADVRVTRDMLAARGLRAVVILPPIHERVLARITAAGLAEGLARFRQDICDIFPQTVDLTESHYSDFRNFFAWDPLHFLPDVGAEIVNEAHQQRLPMCVDVRIGSR